uniref:Uncharacterized protein n=1 Tax=Chondria sp. (in: red algae) TaxID=1982705 RepID=A0A1Z1MCQ0_9FLOR|nr:hypothetical protein [Chondria sp. (in: red algae)]
MFLGLMKDTSQVAKLVNYIITTLKIICKVLKKIF